MVAPGFDVKLETLQIEATEWISIAHQRTIMATSKLHEAGRRAAPAMRRSWLLDARAELKGALAAIDEAVIESEKAFGDCTTPAASTVAMPEKETPQV